MNTRKVLLAWRQRWWLPVGGVITGLLVAGAMTWLTPEKYSSSTRLFVSATGQVDPSGAYEGGLFSQQRMASYAELLTGQQLAGKTAADLKLHLSPAQLAREVERLPCPIPSSSTSR